MIAVLFGIQGVGKSLVATKAISQFPENFWNYIVVGDNVYDLALSKGIIKVENYSLLDNVQIVMEDEQHRVAIIRDHGLDTIYVKKEEDILLSRDYMRNINVATTKVLQQETFRYYTDLVNKDKSKNYLLDTHAALKTKQGYIPGLSLGFIKDIAPELFIIIEASAQEIFDRRVNDKTRKRDHDKSVSDVQVNLDTTRYFASNYSFAAHSPLVIINNKQGEPDMAGNELAEILKKFF
jgi:adenylate kinase